MESERPQRRSIRVSGMSNPQQDPRDPPFSRMFRPTQDVRPSDTESNPEFFIYSRECPYRPVVVPFKRKLGIDGLSWMPILQFWTWHKYLYIQQPSEPMGVGEGLVRCHIADGNGDWCGSIVLDKRWVQSTKYARQEFIAISEAKNFSDDECNDWTYYIQKERGLSEWDLFFVLLIERHGEKWLRVGLGKAFKEAFRDSQWKEIMLG